MSLYSRAERKVSLSAPCYLFGFVTTKNNSKNRCLLSVDKKIMHELDEPYPTFDYTHLSQLLDKPVTPVMY